ncbi:MAG: type III pantothenate kinase [Lachnospiraceae bacterium]|nr:type III pantothenate kinase [Lachnospiraceae bacterium]
MLLVIDVGNTNITYGVYDGKKLLTTFRMTTKNLRTSDEYGINIAELIEHNALKMSDVTDVIISSVVPKVMYSFTSAIVKYFGITPIIVGPGIRTGIKVVTENPKQIGTDRIVDCAGAFYKYGGPAIVLDFGTATTYDLLREDGALAAGVTAPGIRTSAKALWEEAAKLPEIEIMKPDTILAKETITSMQAGLVYGQIGQTEYIIEHMKKESGYKDAKVIATGGMGRIIAENTDSIDVYDADLTLEGLRAIFEKQK